MTNVKDIPEITKNEAVECNAKLDNPKYKQVWEGFGTLKIYPIDIPHDNSKIPVQERYRLIPLQYHQKLGALLDQLQVAWMVEKLDLTKHLRAWVSNPRITEKKSGDIRLNLDARRANLAIDANAEQMPTPEVVRHRLTGATRFSEFDLTHGYWQVPLSKDAQNLQANIPDSDGKMLERTPGSRAHHG